MREGPSNESPNAWWQLEHHRRNSQYSHEETFSGKWTPIGRTKTPLYYAQRASAGLINSEATQISPVGQGYISTPGIHSAEQIERWKCVTWAVLVAGGHIVLQLWHFAYRVCGPCGSDRARPNRAGLRNDAGRPIAARLGLRQARRPIGSGSMSGAKPGASARCRAAAYS
jgi:hypothetical protein